MRRAKYDLLLWDNSDIVYGPNFMNNIVRHKNDADWLGLELVECGAIPVAESNIQKNFGLTADSFDRYAFEKWVIEYSQSRPSIRPGFCWYSPSVWKKQWYIKMGGFNTNLSFPYHNDLDFKNKCIESGSSFAVVNSFAYHFQRAHENLNYISERY